jgi:hypothetical protein
MMRIDQVDHCYNDIVILLDLNFVDIKIKVVIKGWAGVLCLISLTHILVRVFILVVHLINQSGEYSGSTCVDLQCHYLLCSCITFALYLTSERLQCAVRHFELPGLPIDLRAMIAQPVLAQDDTLLA